MSFTITLGWWLMPLAVTVAAFGYRWMFHQNDVYSGGFMNLNELGRLLTALLAGVISLTAWLIWALFG